MTPRERALVISARGGQILLPFDAGDAGVWFSSRWKLVEDIAEAIREGIREAVVKDKGRRLLERAIRVPLPDPRDDVAPARGQAGVHSPAQVQPPRV